MSLPRRFGTGLALALVAFGCGRAPEEPSAEIPVAVVGKPPLESPMESKPVCALLDAGKTPQGAILEAKLLSDASATWVERTNVDAVLKEQQLQAAFGPQGVADRVKLGQLLKADVLVMLRPVKDAKEPALEVVVSETAGGLRLLVRGVASTSAINADVDTLAAAVKDGLKKHGEKVREVVAVPPFVSNDLAYAFDHLKSTFAKLAEGEALDRPGVVVVELEEARAVARELELAGSKLDRPLPLYLLGEYQHEGKGAERTVTLKVRAERGGKPVGGEASRVVKADAAPAAVREWAASKLDEVTKDAARPPSDPKAEAKQLAVRADLFMRIANWEEASALYEASLLLDADRPDVLLAAVRPLGRMATKLRAGGPTPESLRTLRMLQLLAQDHIEAVITREDGLTIFRERASEFPIVMQVFPPHSAPPPGWPVKELAELDELQRGFWLRMIPRVLTVPKGETPFIMHVFNSLPLKDRPAMAEKLLKEWKGMGDERARAGLILLLARGSNTAEADVDYQAFLTRIESTGDAVIRLAVADTRAAVERGRVQHVPVPPPSASRFTPIHVVQESTGIALDPIQGFLPIGPKQDIVWNVNGLHVMSGKGRARTVWWTPAEPNFRFHTVMFDGRYVWAATLGSHRWPFIVVYDTRSGRARTIGAKEGIPQGPDERLKIANHRFIDLHPIGVGKVCAAGSIGRAWIATISMDESGGAEVKIVHEAREVPDHKDEAQGRKTTVDFRPTFVLPLGRGIERRIVIGRTTIGLEEQASNESVQKYPLAFDPATGAISVLDVEFSSPTSFGSRTVFEDGGRLLTVRHRRENKPDDRIELQQLQFPGPTVNAVGNIGLEPAPASRVTGGFVHEGRLIFQWTHNSRLKPPPGSTAPGIEIVYDLRSMKLEGTEPRLLLARTPPFGSLHRSACYGLVGTIPQIGPGIAAQPNEITLEGSPPRRGAKVAGEDAAKSVGSNQEVRFTIVNSANRPIRLFWLDGQGRRRFYREIATGGRFEQPTYSGQYWVVADADDNGWKLIRTEAAPQTFEITGLGTP